MDGLVLGPDFFRSGLPTEAIVPPDVAPEWRVSVEARRIWQDTLQARIDQRKSLKQALLAAVDATEEESLPLCATDWSRRWSHSQRDLPVLECSSSL